MIKLITAPPTHIYTLPEYCKTHKNSSVGSVCVCSMGAFGAKSHCTLSKSLLCDPNTIWMVRKKHPFK